MRIVFMGTSSYATTIFKTLIDNNYEIIALFTQPDKAVGRSQTITPPHIKSYYLSAALRFPIFQPSSLRDDETVKILSDLMPDMILVAAYGHILTKEILEISPCINLHASILPLYRGASPIQETLLASNRHGGVTAIKMNTGLDSGDILAMHFIAIDENASASELFEELAEKASLLTLAVLNSYVSLGALPQNFAKATYCKKIKKEDGLIDLKNAKDVFAKYQAYAGWPGIFLSNGIKFIKIALIETVTKNQDGQILQIKNDFIDIGCNFGSLRVFFVQAPSKTITNAADYIRGKRLQVGNFIY